MSLLSPPLEAFVAIVKHRTVHGAARELGLTQTGVTQRIRALERSLSTTLFTRSRRGMMLTHEGEALLRYCQAARDLEGEALARISGAGTESEVRICLTGPSSILRSRVVPQCLPVLAKFPRLLVTFNISDLEDRADELRAGRAQLAVVPSSQVAREMDSKRLRPERYVLVACRAWKRRPLAEIIERERAIDFDPSDRMTEAYLEKFGLRERMRPERHFLNNTESLVGMFKAGLGYGVLTLEFAEPFVARGDLVVLNAGKVLENELALAWYPRTGGAAYWKALIAAVR